MRLLVAVVLGVGAVLVLTACSGKTTGATKVTDGTATLHATASCDSGQTCTWYWEYWPATGPRSASDKTPVQGPVSGPTGDADLSVTLTGLIPNESYRWVFCASPNKGGVYACAGPQGTFGSTTADPPPDYATFTTLPQRTLAERWDGASWAIHPTPNPTGATRSQLNGVSCTSPSACTAVGYYFNSVGVVTLAERWDGTTWAIQPTPNPSGEPELSGVSCTSATACTAVGTAPNVNVSVTLAERWDGASWAIQPTPSQGRFSQLSGVFCTSATACTAVGGAPEPLAEVPLAERWDGTSWTIQPTPNPSGELVSSFSGVSCASATACTAVGENGDGSTLAEVWDGSTWTVQPTPGTGLLEGVSCTSTTACTAVGFSGARTLAERWDGTAWTIQTTPTVPRAAGGARLLNVSCTSASACQAVGARTVANHSTHTLAERWNGTTWSIQTMPPPSGKFATLSSVSCTSATQCTAVGWR